MDFDDFDFKDPKPRFKTQIMLAKMEIYLAAMPEDLQDRIHDEVVKAVLQHKSVEKIYKKYFPK